MLGRHTHTKKKKKEKEVATFGSVAMTDVVQMELIGMELITPHRWIEGWTGET
jgi:hypothetical protein